MVNAYDVGDLIRVQGAFTNAADVAVDPAAITAKVKTPAGVITTYTYGVDAQLVRASTGIYYVDVSATTTGDWHYRFASTGEGQAAGENKFYVKESAF